MNSQAQAIFLPQPPEGWYYRLGCHTQLHGCVRNGQMVFCFIFMPVCTVCEVQFLCLLTSVYISTVSHCVVLGVPLSGFHFLLYCLMMCSLAAFQSSCVLFRLDGTVELLTVLFCPRCCHSPGLCCRHTLPLQGATFTVWTFHSCLSQWWCSPVIPVLQWQADLSVWGQPHQQIETARATQRNKTKRVFCFFVCLFKRFPCPRFLRNVSLCFYILYS